MHHSIIITMKCPNRRAFETIGAIPRVTVDYTPLQEEYYATYEAFTLEGEHWILKQINKVEGVSSIKIDNTPVKTMLVTLDPNYQMSEIVLIFGVYQLSGTESRNAMTLQVHELDVIDVEDALNDFTGVIGYELI